MQLNSIMHAKEVQTYNLIVLRMKMAIATGQDHLISIDDSGHKTRMKLEDFAFYPKIKEEYEEEVATMKRVPGLGGDRIQVPAFVQKGFVDPAEIRKEFAAQFAEEAQKQIAEAARIQDEQHQAHVQQIINEQAEEMNALKEAIRKEIMEEIGAKPTKKKAKAAVNGLEVLAKAAKGAKAKAGSTKKAGKGNPKDKTKKVAKKGSKKAGAAKKKAAKPQ